MDVLIFSFSVAIVYVLIFYFYMWDKMKKKISRKIFWATGVMAIAYAIVFDGLIDRIFILFFSMFLIFLKFAFSMVET